MDESPNAPPGHRAPRRVATAPIPQRDTTDAASPENESLVETLYSHPNVKLISFTASGRTFSMSSSGPVFKDDEPGTLSWSSQLERTIAVGQFRIYRAPRSVAFLSCGSALQPILPKSQCWCIDEVNSKFVLQIRRPNYWRFELPVDDPEDQRRAEELREVLDKILQFEKTECPFKRSFTVHLEPQTPVRLRPWAPTQRPVSDTPVFDSVTPNSSSDSRRSSFAGVGGSTPASLGPRRHIDLPSSPFSSRPTSSASCGPIVPPIVSQLELSEAEVRNQRRHIPSGLELPHGADYVPNQLDAVFESPTERNPREPFLFTLPEAPEASPIGKLPHIENTSSVARPGITESHSSPSFPTEHDTSSHDEETSVFSSSPGRDESSVYELHEGTGNRGGRMKARLRRTTGFTMARSATLPPHLLLSMDKPEQDTTAPKKGPDAYSSTKTPSAENDGIVLPRLTRRDSEESFHSVESWHSSSAPLPPSPPTSQPETPVDEPREGLALLDAGINRDKASEASSSVGMPCAWESDSDEDDETSQDNTTAAAESSAATSGGGQDSKVQPENADSKPIAAPTPRRPYTRHRATTSSISVRGRPLSPLPPPANLFTPVSKTAERKPFQSRLETMKNLPMAIIAKTCEMLIGPPSHLIALMLRVAAKIASGQWRGLVYGYDADGEQIPVQWDYSEGEFSDWSDDEPYMDEHHKQHGHRRSHSRKNKDKQPAGAKTEQPESSDDSRSWGVD
ncbi:hypothetical protein FDECE_13305 [Fusarium decemcellulare]|nr:hypothetical protein FDECE_13305 [Fusarium decemcellulare]